MNKSGEYFDPIFITATLLDFNTITVLRQTDLKIAKKHIIKMILD